jgi:hypothetical protein
MHTIFWLENLKGRYHLEDLGIDGRYYENGPLGNRVGSVDWMHLSEDRD